MANQWLRLYSEFANDPKIQRMSEALQRRYIMLLCLRCSNGDVTLQDDDVTFQLRISNEEWQETKAIFLAKNLINESNNPAAWDKRQFASDSSAARVSKHREAKKSACNVTVTPQNRTEQNRTDTDTDTERANKSSTGTPAGLVCARLKAECRIPGVNPQHPKLLALLDAGLTADEIIAAGMDSKVKTFAYVLAAAEGRRRDAANVSTLPDARASPRRQATGRQAAIDNYAAQAAEARGDFNERTVTHERDITAEVRRVA